VKVVGLQKCTKNSPIQRNIGKNPIEIETWVPMAKSHQNKSFVQNNKIQVLGNRKKATLSLKTKRTALTQTWGDILEFKVPSIEFDRCFTE